MAKKKLTQAKAKEMLHNPPHGKPLTEQQRKFFGAIAGGAEPYKAQIGTMLTALPSNMMDRLSDALAFPQKAITKLFTGEYQTPSEAMNIQSPAGAIAADVLLDPLTFIGGGAGASKAARAVKASTKSGVLSNVYKLNPWAFKPNPEAYYRGIGRSGLDDALKSGVLRTANKTGSYGEDLYMTPNFKIAKGNYSVDAPTYKGDPFGDNDNWEQILPKDTKSYIAEIPKSNLTNSKTVGSDVIINKGYIPLDKVNLYKQDWLRGYKQVKPPKKQDGGWLDKYDAPQAQNGIEGTMGGLTDIGFNYNGAWNGPSMQMGGSLPGATGMMYARTQSPAPSNGPYAKKTKASAQDGKNIMKGKEYVEQWMNSPMYKEMLEKSAQGPEFERISKGRIAGLKVPTFVSKDLNLSGTNTMGTQSHRIRTMFNATASELEEMMSTVKAAVENPKNKEAKRMAEKVMEPTITGWNIGLNPMLTTGSHDYESVLAHEHGHTTDAPFVGGDLSKMSLAELKKAQSDLGKLYIPESDIQKMKNYQEGKVTTDYDKYVSKPQETRQFLNEIRYLGKTQGVYDPFTEKITPEQYKKIKPLELSSPMDSLRKIYTDEQIIDMLNSISKRQQAGGVPVAQNGQEMKYYQEGLDFTPKTISQDGSKTLPNVNAKRRKPIIVSDPNDPRLRAYQDSLSLYNKGLNPFLRFYDYGDAGQDMRFIKSDYTPTKNWGKTKVKKSDIVEDIKNIKDELNWQENKYVRKNLNDRLALLNQSLQTGVYPTNMVYPQTYSAALVYKKPVQPVILEEEPRFEKPIPIPRDTRDLGYTLPTPGQFTAPKLFEYNPDTPTKYTFTYPTGKYNEQKTMYFPTKSALKSFVGGVRGATYQEGKDYASATGTLQDGGDIPVDPMGYWNPENVGSPVTIPSNIITMEGVDQPLMGISDTGDVQYMEPGEDYEFDGEYVTEYPVAKKGISVNKADAQPLKKLDQLLNFTNYNKPTKGGWLDKYN